MVEHASLIDTELIHEPKGIKESEEGEVYVSNVENPISGPFGGEWRKLRVSDLDLEKQVLSTPTYQDQDPASSLTSSIIAQTTGALSNVTSFGDASKNDQELFLVVSNLLTRLATLEDTVDKLQTLTSSLSDGLMALDLFSEQE